MGGECLARRQKLKWGCVTRLVRAANVLCKVSQLNDLCCILCVVLAITLTLCYETPCFLQLITIYDAG